ncbi:MAG TPA: ATP-binding protein, partial [Streptosporangiaceae bacterium]|nr:ATP-binding protein [Streptosporangiaceae bacterium]
HLELPSRRPSLTKARDAFAGWLSRLDAAAEDWEALHLAMVEVFTNAIEHAYPSEAPGNVELDAELGNDGYVECRVTDQGTWRPPDPADADRGHGLMVAGQVVDRLLVSHPTQAPAGPAAETGAGQETGAATETGTEPETGAVAGLRAAARTAVGTTVALRHRLRRPAILASGHRREDAAHPAEPPFTVDTSVAAGATARALVSGPVDITTADKLARRLLSVSRGGTVPLVADLSGVTQLASAGVRALYAVSEQLAAHGHGLTLITAPGSGAGVVLDLVRLAHVPGGKTAEKEARASPPLPQRVQ